MNNVSSNFARFLLAAFAILTGLWPVMGQAVADGQRYASVFSSGTTEEKRTALFEIRNAGSAELSRTAVAALKDTEDIVRATAAFSVIFLPRDEAEQALLPNLNDRAEIVRRETALALGRIRAPRAAMPLIAQLGKEKKHTEAKAAMLVALGEIGDVASIDFLTRLLTAKPTDKNAFERRAAARSIGKIAEIQQFGSGSGATPESFLPAKLKTAPNLVYRNLSAESASFKTAVSTLSAILRNQKESADARREAAFALGAVGDSSAVAILEQSLSDPDYYLVEISREALRKLTRRD